MPAGTAGTGTAVALPPPSAGMDRAPQVLARASAEFTTSRPLAGRLYAGRHGWHRHRSGAPTALGRDEPGPTGSSPRLGGIHNLRTLVGPAYAGQHGWHRHRGGAPTALGRD